MKSFVHFNLLLTYCGIEEIFISSIFFVLQHRLSICFGNVFTHLQLASYQILRSPISWFLYLTFAQTILFFQSFGHFLFLLEEFCSTIVFEEFVFLSKLQNLCVWSYFRTVLLSFQHLHDRKWCNPYGFSRCCVVYFPMSFGKHLSLFLVNEILCLLILFLFSNV